MNLIKELQPGTIVNISLYDKVHNRLKFKMIYVGLIENEYLILRFQNITSAANDSHDLKPGVQLSIQTVVAQEYLTALNFQVSSLGISKLREPLLLVEYPKMVKGQRLRTTPRISIELMANISYPKLDRQYLALITDFSMTGLKCEYLLSEEVLENPTAAELAGQEIKVEFVANDDLDMDFTICGNVKNARQKEKVHLGVEFAEDDAGIVKSAFAILLMREYGL